MTSDFTEWDEVKLDTNERDCEHCFTTNSTRTECTPARSGSASMNGEKVKRMIKDEFVLMFDKMPTATAQQKGINYRTGTVYTKKKVQDVKDMFLERLKEHAPEHPIEGAVAITIHFQFDIKDKKKRGKWKTTRPDTDNMEKLLLDCMTKAGFWLDDSQVVSKWSLKQYSELRAAAIVINYREVFDE